MELMRSFLLLTIFAINGAAVPEPTQNPHAHENNQMPHGSDLLLHLDEEVHAMSSKLASLERKMQNMELTINLHTKEIKALQNRKDVRCESGILGQHTNPPPTWPYTQNVTFQTPFEQAPTVTYGLYLLDSAWDKNVRVTTEVSRVTKTGFQITMNKWADTVLYGGRISWMACGK